jgi:hypothetical protein
MGGLVPIGPANPAVVGGGLINSTAFEATSINIAQVLADAEAAGAAGAGEAVEAAEAFEIFGY